MPRIKRGLVSGEIYHVLNRGNAKQTVFFKDQDFQAFLDLMKESLTHFNIKLYAYCLMPNHFHLISSFSVASEFSGWMQWLMTAHVRRYHKHYGGSGHVWQGRFKSFLIQRNEYLLTVLRYVEANPLRAQLVNSADAWQWSSYVERIGNCSRNLLSDPPIEFPSKWSDWVNRAVSDSELDVLRCSVNRQTPYGANYWQNDMIQKLGLESTLRPRGRPWPKK